MVRVYKNFLSKEECAALNASAMLGVAKGWVDTGISVNGVQIKERLTSRMHMKDAEYPKIVLDTSKKIRDFLSISSYPLITEHGKDGAVVSVTFKGGDVYPHKDPRSKDMQYAAYRCNVLTQAPTSGGQLQVGSKDIQIEEGDLHCYLASEIEHKVTKVEGATPRILWMFGAYVPINAIQKFTE
jgi:hypothetical protein